MKSSKQVCAVTMCLILATVFSAGCSAIESTTYKDVNRVFEVKETHLGHSHGHDYITVVYYNGTGTEFINNDNYYKKSNEIIQIDIVNTNDTVQRLVYVKTLGDQYDSDYPHDVYKLYMPVNQHFIGTNTEYEISSRKSTAYEQATMS